MSIWATVTGNVTIPLKEHFSLREYTKSFFDEFNLDITHKHVGEIDNMKISLTFTGDSIEAAGEVDEWVKGIPGYLDITAEIRWIK